MARGGAELSWDQRAGGNQRAPRSHRVKLGWSGVCGRKDKKGKREDGVLEPCGWKDKSIPLIVLCFIHAVVEDFGRGWRTERGVKTKQTKVKRQKEKLYEKDGLEKKNKERKGSKTDPLKVKLLLQTVISSARLQLNVSPSLLFCSYIKVALKHTWTCTMSGRYTLECC